MKLKIENEMLFQSTPLREGRPEALRLYMKQAGVSIHAPARGATYIMIIIVICKGFQSTPLREGRPDGPRVLQSLQEFQSTPLREGRHQEYEKIYLMSGFNPRPCARGDVSLCSGAVRSWVSIHAPARGAT